MPLAKEILALNAKRSREYCAPAARDARALYSSIHPTNILVFKCMDGRINLPLITGIPMGILHPFRNIGGKFLLGNPYLGRLVLDAKDDAIEAGNSTLALCTYHFSRGSEHRGCAGHHYDTAAAYQGAVKLKEEFEEVFGKQNPAIGAIVVGIETDEDALIFHNGQGKKFAIADHVEATDETIKNELSNLYVNLSRQVLSDLFPLALGNRDHVAGLRKQGRPIADLVHGESIIAIGRGFDWLHLPNRALIIGPYGNIDSSWRSAVEVAGGIVLNNFRYNKTLKKNGALLLVSASYVDIGERGLAIAKAKYFAAVAEDALKPMAKKLALKKLIGITDMETMKFHPLPKF